MSWNITKIQDGGSKMAAPILLPVVKRLSTSTSISYDSVLNVLHEHLGLSKVCARSGSKLADASSEVVSRWNMLRAVGSRRCQPSPCCVPNCNWWQDVSPPLEKFHTQLPAGKSWPHFLGLQKRSAGNTFHKRLPCVKHTMQKCWGIHIKQSKKDKEKCWLQVHCSSLTMHQRTCHVLLHRP